MKIALCVSEFNTNEVERNIQTIAAAASAAKERADILCFGEAVLQGFNALNADYDRDIQLALSQDSLPIKKLQDTAKINKIALGFGYLERVGFGIYSSYMVIDKSGGILYNYNRVSPGWKEHHWGKQYKEGKEFGLFNFCGVDIAVGLCGDFWFDEALLNKENIKSDIVLWPVFTDSESLSDADWWTKETTINEYALQSTKIGKQVLLVNSLLHEKDEPARGRAIYFENGKIKCQLSLDKSGILVCDITENLWRNNNTN